MSLRTQRLFWCAFSHVVLVIGGFWVYRVTTRLSIEEQRSLVPESTMWGMHGCVVAIIAGLAASSRYLSSLFNKKQLVVAVSLSVWGYFACGIAPQTSRIFFDEHIYMQIGQTIAHTGRAEGANYARAEYGKFEMYSPWVNKQPNGLPYLLSWLYRIAGVSDNVSHFLNRAVVGVSASLIYLALSTIPWSLPYGAPLIAALLYTLTPLVLWWGHTVAVEPSAAGTMIFAFSAACLHVRLRETETSQGMPCSALILAGAVAFAIYFRPESILVFLLGAFVLWSTDDHFIEDSTAWGALALSVSLGMPNLLHLWSMRTEDWGASDGRRFDFDFVGKNLESNLGYFVNSHWFPIAGTVFAFLGILWLLSRCSGAALTLGVWFGIAWGIFVLFYAGGYYYGASSRYAVISCPPVAILMGIGLAVLLQKLRRSRLLMGLVVAASIINWTSTLHYIPTVGREAIEAEMDVQFVARAAKELPQGSLVLSPDPCIWLLQGINSSQYFIQNQMLQSQMYELVNQYPGGIYAHWSFWHNAEPKAASETAGLIVATNAQEVLRAQCQSHKLAIYRLDTPAALKKFGGVQRVKERPSSDLDELLGKGFAASQGGDAVQEIPRP